MEKARYKAMHLYVSHITSIWGENKPKVREVGLFTHTHNISGRTQKKSVIRAASEERYWESGKV